MSILATAVPERCVVMCCHAVLAGLLVSACAPALAAQVQVRDSLGAPVPFAILEAPSGKRVVADADGLARGAVVADGPWSARRIGYRPGTDDDGDGRIVLGRAPLALPVRYVAAEGPCTAERVAARGADEVLSSVRMVFSELQARREIAVARVSRVGFRSTTRLITERGDTLDAGTEVDSQEVRAQAEFPVGRVIERRGRRYIFHRPGLGDIVSPTFLGAHCLSVTSGDDSSRAAIRFEPVTGAKGSHVIGTFVVERATGRLLEDTLRYVGAPRGAPQQAMDVAVFAADPADALGRIFPARIINTFEPSDFFVRRETGERQRVVRIVVVYERDVAADRP